MDANDKNEVWSAIQDKLRRIYPGKYLLEVADEAETIEVIITPDIPPNVRVDEGSSRDQIRDELQQAQNDADTYRYEKEDLEGDCDRLLHDIEEVKSHDTFKKVEQRNAELLTANTMIERLRNEIRGLETKINKMKEHHASECSRMDEMNTELQRRVQELEDSTLFDMI